MSLERSDAAIGQAYRDEWGRVVATLIRRTGDWDLAEECAQDAFAVVGLLNAGRPRVPRNARERIPRRPELQQRSEAVPKLGQYQKRRGETAPLAFAMIRL